MNSTSSASRDFSRGRPCKKVRSEAFSRRIVRPYDSVRQRDPHRRPGSYVSSSQALVLSLKGCSEKSLKAKAFDASHLERRR